MPNPFTHPVRLPLVAASILSADFANLGRECAHVLADAPHGAGADLLHLDVMDGHFVPNLTMGPDVCKSLHAALPEAFLDVHLMVREPGKFFAPFARAGAGHVTFHVEVAPTPAAVRELVHQAHDLGMSAGLAINPPTPVHALDGLLEWPDLLLVMSVNPGFAGQTFIDDTVTKTRALRARLAPNQRLEMDGGIGPLQAERVRLAGCDVIVAASAIFREPPANRATVVRRLRGNGQSG